MFLAVSLPYSFLTNTQTSDAMVFALHLMGYQESMGDVLKKQDYPLHRTNRDTKFKQFRQTCGSL